jgi:hypothetical protein
MENAGGTWHFNISMMVAVEGEKQTYSAFLAAAEDKGKVIERQKTGRVLLSP